MMYWKYAKQKLEAWSQFFREECDDGITKSIFMFRS